MFKGICDVVGEVNSAAVAKEALQRELITLNREALCIKEHADGVDAMVLQFFQRYLSELNGKYELEYGLQTYCFSHSAGRLKFLSRM